MADADTAFATADLTGVERFQRFREALGIKSFGLNVFTLQPRQRLRVHVHECQEEVYAVLEGELTLTFDKEARTLHRGDFARVGPGRRRQLVNQSSQPVVLLIVGASAEHTHQSRDALAWTTWEEEGDGRPPQEVPLPEDLPA